jgi:hypothetical protein
MKSVKLVRLTVCLALAVLLVYGAHWCTTQASSSLIAWTPGLAIGLPMYNSTIEASDTWFFSQFQWDDANASRVTFSNTRMDTGAPFTTLGVETTVNMSFSSLGESKISYLVEDDGTQIFSGVTEPDSVKVDGVVTDVGWNYNSGTLAIIGASTSVEVLFAQGLTADDAVAIAIAFGVIAIAFAVVFGIVWSRKRNED